MKSEEDNRRIATQLMNTAMTYARVILKRYGELGLFGYAMNREGEVARQKLEIPRLPTDPNRLWKLLGEHMQERARRGLVQAVAMAADVSLDAPSAEGYVDAVEMAIEVEGGYAIEVTVPYRIYGGQLRNLLPRRIAVGKPVMEERESRIFGTDGPKLVKGSEQHSA
jgi:hypothetical protein